MIEDNQDKNKDRNIDINKGIFKNTTKESTKNTSLSKNHRQRVKDKVLKSGIIGMADYEILEMFLFYAIPRKDTKPIAKNLLAKFETIEKVLHASKEEVLKVEGVGESVYSYFKFMREFNKVIYHEEMRKNIALNSVEATYKYLKSSIGHLEKEVFKIIYLSSANELLGIEDLFLGTIDKSAIYPREVVKEALKYNAKSVIFSHNHPSGSLRPSKSDLDITNKLKEILKPLEIKVLDHIIISTKGYYSFLEEGII